MKHLILFLLLFSYQTFGDIGGKAESLVKLEKVCPVPRWFCVDTSQFQEFVNHNAVDDVKAQEMILRGEFSEEFCIWLENKITQLRPPFAVRSSCVCEDLPGSSFAGAYDTFLHQKDVSSVKEAIKKCWASVFNTRAIVERERLGIDHAEALPAVIVQEMVEAKVAGTAFTMEIGTGYPGIEIVANWGLGESVVEGEVVGDKWLVHPETNRILVATKGNKKSKAVPAGDNSGTKKMECSLDEQQNWVLEEKEVQNIALQLKKIADSLGNSPLDTEFAIDKKGKLYFLQARPLVTVPMGEVVDAGEDRILAKGDFGVRGVAHGKLKVISSFEDLESGKVTIGPDDIVLTHVSTNKWSQYMTNFKGMITQEGGPTSHPILLCRERKVPCVIGLSQASFAKLKNLNGTFVTIDGLHQIIYEGKLPLKRVCEADWNLAFDVIGEEKILDSEEQLQNFKDFDLLIEEVPGEYWQKKPAYPLDPLMQEINLLGFSKIEKLLGNKFPTVAKVIGKFTAHKFMTDQEKLRYFSHMDLEKCEAFFEDHRIALKEFSELTNDFVLTKKNWCAYVALMSKLRSYIWLGHTFRLHANQQAARVGRELKIPKYYAEEYQAFVQSQEIEEDTLMIRDIKEMAKEIAAFEALEQLPGELLERLKKLAMRYRFQENLSFEAELDLERVFRRVKNEKNPNMFSKEERSLRRDFFPQDEALRRWFAIGVRSRILQSNTHHQIIRGQWKVREALLKLGGSEIFNRKIEEVNALL